MTFFFQDAVFTFSKKTLVVPIVSTANVAQLAVDLLITSLSLCRVGIFDPKYLIPVVGEGDDGFTTPLELYGKEGIDVAVIQQRSPVLKSHKIEFVDALLAFIKASGCASVLFLSGMDPSNRTDAQMLTPTYYIRPENTPDLTSTALANLPGLLIPPYTSPVTQRPGDIPQNHETPFIPGGGLTRRILSRFSLPWQIPTAALLRFVHEGDNREDAHAFAVVAAKVVGVDTLINEWKEPKCWKQDLFGAPPDQTIYG